MSIPRRVPSIIGRTVAVLIGSGVSASATSAESVAVVTCYRVTAHSAGAPAHVLRTTGPTDEVHVDDDPALQAPTHRIPVTTLAGPIWTAESVKVPVAKC